MSFLSKEYPWKILIVDDDEEDYFLACSMLARAKSRKFLTEWARTYELAQARLESEVFQAVLMDYDLGGRTGLQLIREMAPRYPGAFILYTGQASDAVDEEAVQAGASMYMVKGETSARMLETGIRYAVERKQVELALSAQQSQSEAIFEAQQDVVLLYDLSMTARRANETFRLAFGFEPVGMHVRQIAQKVSCRNLDGQPLDWGLQPTPQALQGKKMTGLCFLVTDASGQDRVVQTSSSPLWQQDRVAGSVTVWHDITDLQEARHSLEAANARLKEQADALEVQTKELLQQTEEMASMMEQVRVSEATLRGFLDATKESIWLFSKDGIILMGNQTALSRLKLPAEEVIGHPFREFMPAETAVRRQQRIDEVARTGQPLAFEDERAGIVFLHNFYPVYNLYGQVAQVASFSRDITESKQRENELSQANRILAANNKSGKAMLHTGDEAAYLQEVCRIITEDCGYAMVWVGYAEQDEARSVRVMASAGFEEGYLDTLHLTWADTERGRGPTGRAIRSGQPSICRDMRSDPAFLPWREEAVRRGYSASIVLPLKFGEEVFGALTLYSRAVDPFTDREIELLEGIANDLAHGVSNIRLREAQRKAQIALSDYAAKLERSNQELENFAFAASHDLQEPLRKIEMFGNLLIQKSKESLDETGQDYLTRMQSAAERMRHMVDGLLALSRVTSQGKPFVRVDLQQVLRTVLDDLQARAQQVNGRIRVGELPAILADPIQMHQLFQNLIGNALKFHQADAAPVVNITAKSISRQQVEILVEDNGIGFNQEHAGRIFQPFVRLSGRSEYEGSGMGLAICQRIVERHSGTISVSSQPGEGSRFTIVLPVGPVER